MKVCTPRGSVASAAAGTTSDAVPPATVAVPSVVVPSRKVTVPVGPTDGTTVAVSVTVSPKTGVAFDGASVEVVAPCSTTSVTSLNIWFASGVAVSTTWSVKVKVPACVGVPASLPCDSWPASKPGGRLEPSARLQVSCPVPAAGLEVQEIGRADPRGLGADRPRDDQCGRRVERVALGRHHRGDHGGEGSRIVRREVGAERDPDGLPGGDGEARERRLRAGVDGRIDGARVHDDLVVGLLLELAADRDRLPVGAGDHELHGSVRAAGGGEEPDVEALGGVAGVGDGVVDVGEGGVGEVRVGQIGVRQVRVGEVRVRAGWRSRGSRSPGPCSTGSRWRGAPPRA